MKRSLLILFLIITANSYSQNDSIKAWNIFKKAYVIDSLSVKPNKISSVKLDSITAKVSYFVDKVDTENYFAKSKTELSVSFYFEKSKLILIRIKEKSKSMKDLSNTTEYYYENDKMFSERNYHGARICMAIPFGKSIYELYGYNKSLNSVFLKNYVKELLDKTKRNYR